MSQKPKTITTIAIYFDEEKIDSLFQVLQILVIKKSNRLEFEYVTLTDKHIFQFLYKLSKQVQDVLSLFSEEKISCVGDCLCQKYVLIVSGPNFFLVFNISFLNSQATLLNGNIKIHAGLR